MCDSITVSTPSQEFFIIFLNFCPLFSIITAIFRVLFKNQAKNPDFKDFFWIARAN
jgi:hypothetical protein